MTRLVSLIILAVLVIAFGVIFFQVMAGFFLPMFMAVLLAIIFRPVHHLINEYCRGHERLAAALTTIAILVIVLVPLLTILVRATHDALSVLASTEGGLRIDESQFNRIIERVNEWSPIPLDAKQVHDYAVAQARDFLGMIALNTPATVGRIMLGLFVTVFSLYYFLAEGSEMIGSTVKVLPLRDKYLMQLVEEFEEVARAVITATAVGAIAQGIMGGIGFYFAGMSSIFLLILLVMLSSMIPVIGAAPVWLGCGAWLYFSDRPLAGILLAVYGLAVAITVDNVLRPIVLHGRSKLHPLLALLSVIGGVQYLGPIGLFVGPMAVAFLQAGLQMFHSELAALEKQKKAAQ